MKLSEVCRLCLIKSSVNSDELFLPISESFEKKFNEIANNKVSFAKAKNVEDLKMFPIKVCITCWAELDQHYNYMNGLIERQKQLNALLGITEEIEEEPLEEPAQQLQKLVKNEETREVESITYVMSEVDDNDNEQPDLKIEKTTCSSSEYNVGYGVTFEAYDQTEDETPRDFEYVDYEAAESDSEEDFNENGDAADEFNDEDLEATVDQLEDQEDDELICSIENKSVVDTDSDYVVYEEDIAMEEESQLGALVLKRKYSKKSKDSPNQFRCWVKNCEASFSFRATMRKHMLQSHSITCDKSTCFICGEKYDNYPDFLAHMKSHTRKAQCDVCKLTFVDDEKLQKHTLRVHVKNDDDERNFQCHICNARFKRKEHVNSHIVYKHSDKSARKFKCQDCPSIFLTRQDLKNHEKGHLQVKIKCVYCPYDCRDLKSIKRHCLKLHNTTKIYKCLCDENFELHRLFQSHKKSCQVVALN